MIAMCLRMSLKRHMRDVSVYNLTPLYFVESSFFFCFFIRFVLWFATKVLLSRVKIRKS